MIESKHYSHGWNSGQLSERNRILKYLEREGIPRPISDARVIECEHGYFGWDVCEDCGLQQIIDFIESGEPKEACR